MSTYIYSATLITPAERLDEARKLALAQAELVRAEAEL